VAERGGWGRTLKSVGLLLRLQVIATRSVGVNLAQPFKAGLTSVPETRRRVSDAKKVNQRFHPSRRDGCLLGELLFPGLERPG
jgi:hypothetical protein